MREKLCPYKPKCGAFRIKEIKGERDFIREYCNSNDEEKIRENCVHFKLRETGELKKKGKKTRKVI